MKWEVARDYELRQVRAMNPAGRLASAWVIAPVGSVVRTFDSVDVPRLFRDFCDVPVGGDGSGYIAFARRFGLLGLPVHEGGELAEAWTDELMAVWRLLQRWDAVKARRARSLVPILIPRSATLKADAAASAQQARRVEVAALEAQIIEGANEHLQKHQLVPRLRSVRVGESVRFALDYEPTTLIGLIWLQCLWALTGRQDFTRCENEACGHWLELAPSRGKRQRRGRADKRFCSDLCRATWHQNQKRQAKLSGADKLSG